jgi:predicted nucleic acid-binding protein
LVDATAYRHRGAALKVKAQYLLETLESEKATLVIFSVVLAECLTGVRISQRLSFIAKMESRFRISPFDGRAALEYAQLAAPPDASRENNKFDMQIVATAIASGVDVLYSEDTDVHEIGRERLDVRRLPKLPEQQHRFDM